MALWKILVIAAVLTVLSTECKATTRWWERLFEGTGGASDSDSADAGTPWWDEYEEDDRWWETEDDSLAWDDNQADGKELSG